MRDISLHVLDVAENSIAAEAGRIDIGLWDEGDLLHVQIADDGRGMSEEQTRRAADPFFTTKGGKRIGLGLALLARAARESGGDFDIDSSSGGGTRVHAVFVRTHPDCKPLGDMEKTLQVLRLSHPEIDIRYHTGKPEGGCG